MRNNRILVVDDDPVNILVLREALEDDYTVFSARSGEEALSLVNDVKPEIIIMDIMMPGLNGYEVTRRIKKNPDLSETKIILVSGKSKIPEKLEGYEAGADDYIVKPFVYEELQAKVRVFLALRRAEEYMNKESDNDHRGKHKHSVLCKMTDILLTDTLNEAA